MTVFMPKFGDPIPAEFLPEIESQLREAMSAAGVVPREELNFSFDGKVHRFRVEGDKPGQESGAYSLYPDWWPSGWFQDHRLTDVVRWGLDAGKLPRDDYKRLYRDMQTEEYRQKQKEQREARERKRKEGQAAAADRARVFFDNAPPAPASHAYLQKKGVADVAVAVGGVKVDGGENLLVPLRDVRGRFQSMQRISPDGVKRYEPGCPVSGAFFHVGDMGSGDFFVCEGFATALSVHKVRREEGATVAAMSCGNLPPVLKELRQVYPDRRLFVLADDDFKTLKKGEAEGRKDAKNPGMAAALDCLRLHLCDGVVPPPFDRAPDKDGEPPSDWNDFLLSHGEAATAEALDNAVKAALEGAAKGGPQEATVDLRAKMGAICCPLDRAIKVEPPALVGNLFPRGKISVIAAPSGSGKTWFCLRCAGDLSVGGEILGGFSESAPQRSLIFCGEAGAGMVLQRAQVTRWPIDKQRVTLVDGIKAEAAGVNLFLSSSEGLSNIEHLIDLHFPDVVFVDSLVSFNATDENKAAEVAPVFQKLNALAANRGIALVLVHHTRKKRAVERGLPMTQDDVIGSSVINRVAAQIIGLGIQEQTENGQNPPVLVRVLKSWYRHFSPFSFQIIDGECSGEVDMVIDLNPDLGSGDTSDRVLDFVYENFNPGEEFATATLARLGVAKSTLRFTLDKLVRAGKLRASGQNKGRRYCLPVPCGQDETPGGQDPEVGNVRYLFPQTDAPF